ncbi:hypothetical protein [Lysobacter enzymogenes]|uniref:hypothetical protein n=1 Tax=Lysobacter enzymogenes TaxID=69 RepID=UPI0008961AC5|nr:hypothetical protein [Lysobacter enzymogenes]SDX24320.1 hypothetical protein SAMN05421681_104341 [Lysobacter enzymogenes]
MNRWDWIYETNDAIYSAINACWNEEDQRTHTWDENRITGDVLRAIGTSGTVHWEDKACSASWRMFKAYGDYETANGDIALNVTLCTQRGHVLAGVKHFEAKAACPDKKKYKAISRSQLGRMVGLVNHEVLLYSIQPVFKDHWWPGKPCPGAGSLPTELALALEPDGHTALNANAVLFVRVLADALCGRGLDTNPKRVSAFQHELNRVDARYVGAPRPIAPLQRPAFLMQARVAIGANLELRSDFTPPKAYRSLPEAAPPPDKPSGGSPSSRP